MVIDLLRMRLRQYTISWLSLRIFPIIIRRRYMGRLPDLVTVQRPGCNNCIAVALANALRAVYGEWTPDVDTTFAKAGGTCEEGVDDIDFLDMGVYYGEPFNVNYVYRIVPGVERYMPNDWLALGAFQFRGMYHVVYIYAFDEKYYYVLNAYPGWGDSYKGKVPKYRFVRLYVVKPTYPKPPRTSEGGTEHIL